MKILVLGGSGLVGSRFITLGTDYMISAPTHEELDLLDQKHVEEYLSESDAEMVLNCAAYTNVDEAEKEKDNQDGVVYKLNTALPAFLAQTCAALNKYLVHLSTDYIFDGTKASPYLEDDPPNPVNWYGVTKMLGEDAVKNISPEFLIVRPEMPYSANFNKKLDIARVFVKMLKEGKVINGVSDQKITPVFVDDLVEALFRLIEIKAGGIYHVASTDSTTPYDFALMIAEKFGLDKNLIKAVPVDEYNKTRPAIRPKSTYLDVTKFENEFEGSILKTVAESINEFYAQMNNKS